MSESGGRNVVVRMAIALTGAFLLYANLRKESAPESLHPILIGIAFFALALGIVYLNDRWKARLARKASQRAADEEKVARQINARSQIAACAFAGFFMLFVLLVGAPRSFVSIDTVPGMVLIFLAGVAVLWIVFLPAGRAFLPGRLLRDRAERRAYRKAIGGDVHGAIDDLHDLIDAKGPSASRSAVLGDCLLMARDWSKACVQFRDAERYDGAKGRFLGREGIALLKLGRAADAVEVLRKASATEPKVATHALNLCLALADLRRTEEARIELARAERLLKRRYLLGANERRKLEELLKECQRRLIEG